MRTFLAAAVLLMIFSPAIFAQIDKQKSDTETIAEAQTFEKELIGALRKGDRDALEKMLGDGFVFIHSTGLLETRDEYLKNSASGNLALQRMEIQNFDQTWRVFEGVTVVRYERSVMRNAATNSENRLRNINVYVKTKNKGWQWVSGQSTRLPVRPKAAAIDAKLFDDYAGVYQIGADRTFVVTKENGALYGLTTGRRKAELVPSSENVFTLFDEENDPGFMQVAFERGANGKTSEAVLRLNNREVWRAKKAK